MAIRTVRLDDDAESILTYVRERTGMSITDALKEGLRSYAMSLRGEDVDRPVDVYRKLDLGPGGYAIAPASKTKSAVADAVRRKYGRDPG